MPTSLRSFADALPKGNLTMQIGSAQHAPGMGFCSYLHLARAAGNNLFVYVHLHHIDHEGSFIETIAADALLDAFSFDDVHTWLAQQSGPETGMTPSFNLTNEFVRAFPDFV